MKKVLSYLNEKELIIYTVDKSDSSYFVAALLHSTEETMEIGTMMEARCKVLAVKYKKRSWVQIYKIWLAIQYTYQEGIQPFTFRELSDMTGLSKHQVQDSMKILESENYFNKKIEYMVHGE